MKLNGERFREGQDVCKGKLYRIPKTMSIPIKEIQSDKTYDLVQVEICIKDGEYGCFGKEYRSPAVTDEKSKRADIFGLIVSDERKILESYIFDVKRNVGGAEVIFHLIQQIRTSYQYKKSLLIFLNGYEEQEHLGAIVGAYSQEKVWTEIEKRQSELCEKEKEYGQFSEIVAFKLRQKELKIKAEIKELSNFYNGMVEIDYSMHPIEIICMKQVDGNYYAKMVMQLGEREDNI